MIQDTVALRVHKLYVTLLCVLPDAGIQPYDTPCRHSIASSKMQLYVKCRVLGTWVTVAVLYCRAVTHLSSYGESVHLVCIPTPEQIVLTPH